MFGFLKDKLKATVEKFKKKVEEEGEEEVKEEVVEKKPLPEEKAPAKEEIVEKKPEVEKKSEKKPEKEEIREEPEEEKKEEVEEKEIKEKPKEKKKGILTKIKERIKKKEIEEAKERVEEVKEEIKEEKKEEEKKGFFEKVKKKITTKKINEKQFNELFDDFELEMLENNVAVEVIEKIKRDMKVDLVDVPLKKGEIGDSVKKSLKESIEDLFAEKLSLYDKIKEKKPLVIVFVGVNGSGKTTTIARLAYQFKEKGISSVIAAADTFRAAAIDQLEEHGNKIGVKVIKHDYGADPAAVAFDAIKHAEAKKIDVVLIDTAGRQHSNINLVDEMKKIVRVAKPDLKIFVGESIVGNDSVEQAKQFNDAIGIDGIVLTKADIDERGGAAISVSYVTGKPIVYLGVGQEMEDLKEFNKKDLIKQLGL